jgi:glutathione S-transferase
MMTYTLHYTPDNASLIVRLVLLELGVPFDTRLLERQNWEQNSAAYLRLNPNGLIPVLENPNGAIFETAAIILWLADRYETLAPAVQDGERASFIKWLFWLSNTLHPALRMLSYPEKYIDAEAMATNTSRQAQKQTLLTLLDLIEKTLQTDPVFATSTPPNVIKIYLLVCLRWLALYPKDENYWFDLDRWSGMQELCWLFEARPSVQQAALAKGLGETVFSNPSYTISLEGSAT